MYPKFQIEESVNMKYEKLHVNTLTSSPTQCHVCLISRPHDIKHKLATLRKVRYFWACSQFHRARSQSFLKSKGNGSIK